MQLLTSFAPIAGRAMLGDFHRLGPHFNLLYDFRQIPTRTHRPLTVRATGQRIENETVDILFAEWFSVLLRMARLSANFTLFLLVLILAFGAWGLDDIAGRTFRRVRRTPQCLRQFDFQLPDQLF